MPAVVFTVPPLAPEEDSRHRLDTVLSRLSGESRSFVQSQIESGRVRVNGQVATKPKMTVKQGDSLEADWKAAPRSENVEAIAGDLQILFEDDSLLVIDKPQGLVVHPAPSHSGETLVHHLLHHLESDEDFSETSEERPGIVHRLDKGTSGVLLVAKNRHAQEALSAQFKDRKIKKTYEALCWGTLTGQGQYRSAIGRDRANRRKMSSRTQKGRDSLTEWKAVTTWKHFTHVSLAPHTGRTHQLRVHLAEDSHPIVGDPLYGRGLTEARRKALAPELVSLVESLQATLLHAAELKLTHPLTGAPLVFRAPRPAIFEMVLQRVEEFDQ